MVRGVEHAGRSLVSLPSESSASNERVKVDIGFGHHWASFDGVAKVEALHAQVTLERGTLHHEVARQLAECTGHRADIAGEGIAANGRLDVRHHGQGGLRDVRAQEEEQVRQCRAAATFGLAVRRVLVLQLTRQPVEGALVRVDVQQLVRQKLFGRFAHLGCQRKQRAKVFKVGLVSDMLQFAKGNLHQKASLFLRNRSISTFGRF